MNFILDTYSKLIEQDDGKQKFSDMVCEITPYFKSINPLVLELRPGYGKWFMKKNSEIENHLGNVHTIAMCNLCELTVGMATEVTIPSHKTWGQIGMEVAYKKEAKTDLTAHCFFENIEWEHTSLVDINVYVKDINDQEVISAIIKMKIFDKKDN